MLRVDKGANVEPISKSGLLEIVEISEWLDWMRRELPPGDVELPEEDTSVLIAANALRFTDRVRPLCYHLPIGMRSLLIEAVILHQCWSRQRKLWRGLPSDRNRGLRTVEGGRYIRQMSEEGHHLMEAHDGIRYVVKFASDRRQNTLSTEAICTAVGRLMHLSEVPSFVVTIDAKLGKKLAAIGIDSFKDTSNPGPGFGFRFVDPGTGIVKPGRRKAQPVSPTLRQSIGRLIFDILTLNPNLVPASTEFCTAAGGANLSLVDHGQCMMNADWQKFRCSTYAEAIGQSEVAGSVRTFSQLDPWIRCAEGLDMHEIWNLVFHLPPQWYGENRVGLVRVVDKLSERAWTLRRSIYALRQRGYFPNMEKLPSNALNILPLSTL
jgi:hypothetical protein